MNAPGDGFTGRWLNSQFCCNPDGVYAGRVQQIRRLEKLPSGERGGNIYISHTVSDNYNTGMDATSESAVC